MEQLLIVEDDIGLNQGLCKALKVDDRKVISCKDLKTAKEQLLCGGVSLILLDINLPDGSGLARQIISGESGYIKVASVPGKGSTFSIFLPK